MAERIYDDKEIGQILGIAAEIQASHSRTNVGGLTLPELQKMAEELGLNPKAIEQAASEVDSSPRSQPYETSDSVLLSKSVSGLLTDQAWEDMVMEARSFAGAPGKAETSAHMREWVSGSDYASVTLTATFRNGRTRIRLLSVAGLMTGQAVTFGLAAGILIATLPIIYSTKVASLDPALTFALCALIVGITALAAREILKSNRRRHGAKIEALMDRLAATAEAGTSQEDFRLMSINELPVSEETPARIDDRA